MIGLNIWWTLLGLGLLSRKTLRNNIYMGGARGGAWPVVGMLREGRSFSTARMLTIFCV